MPVSGLDWKFQVKNFSDLFRRWGSHATNIRGVFNGILPVQVIDRFRDDEEGSVYALYAETQSLGATLHDGEHPAIVLGSVDENVEIEILGFQVWYAWQFFGGNSQNSMLHLFTPIEPYTPLDTAVPVGTWVPGLITNHGFHRSSAVAIAGYAAAMPAYTGWTGYVISRNYRAASTTSRWVLMHDQGGLPNLAMPIRMPPGSSIAWQAETLVAPGTGGPTLALAATILFRERRFVA